MPVNLSEYIGTFVIDDDSNSHTISLVSGDGDTDNHMFEISTTKLFLNEPINTEQTRSIRIKVNDGEYDVEKVITLEFLTDIDEAITAQSGDFEFTIFPDLMSSLMVWYDATNIDGANNASLSNGSTISKWFDLSGNDRHAETTNASLYPSFQEENSLLADMPTVLFNSTSKYLPISGDSFIAKHFFVVTRSTASRFNSYGSPFGSQDGSRVIIYENNQTYFHSNVYPKSLKRNTVPKSGNFNIAPIDEFMLLNVQSGTSHANKSRKYNINRQDSHTNANEIAELIVFDRELTSHEENLLTFYLSKKWGFENSIDSDGDGIKDANDLSIDDYNLNQAPEGEFINSYTTFKEGDTYTFNVTATDADGDDVNIAVLHPRNTTITRTGLETASIEWTALSNQIGDIQFIVEISDGINNTLITEDVFIENVSNDPPVDISIAETEGIFAPISAGGVIAT